ncbi:MFS transporter [Jatrophihabitans fulvus]
MLLLSAVQSVVIPVLPQIGAQLNAGVTATGWVTTATMLTASAVTPLLGRLGDVRGQKPVLIAALVMTLAGSLLAATTHSIGLLIIARALQGFSFGLFPLAISVLRTELPTARLTGAMAITASGLGVGSGLALVATGLLTRGDADYRRVFWLCTVLTVIVLALVVRLLPSRKGQGGRVDYLGALVLSAGLVSLLLPVSQGHDWGWGSTRVIVLFALAAVLLVGFVALQRRTAAPLVSPALLGRRPVLVTNLTALCVGFGMFAVFVGATYFVQSSRALTGFGFTASTLETSVVFMLPGAVAGLFAGPVAGRLVAGIGPRRVLILACGIGVLGMLGLAFLHGTSGEVVASLVIANVSIAVAYAAMPALLVSSVAPHETGIANSINSIMRTVGGAMGSALVVTILASDVATHATPAGPLALPVEGAYRLVFLLGAGFFVLSALLMTFAMPKAGRPLSVTAVHEDEAIGAAGEFAMASVDIDADTPGRAPATR